jgi:hypothetical protein
MSDRYKPLLLMVFMWYTSVALSQPKIFIKVQNQTLATTVEDDNSQKFITINSNGRGMFIIYNSNMNESKNWNRSFMIIGEDDKELLKFRKTTTNEYKMHVSEVLSKLQKNKNDSLYTIALPTDSAKASVIGVRRVMVCKLQVK